jgi:glucokinase
MKDFTEPVLQTDVMKPRLGIGVDVGASRVRACVGHRQGRIVWRASQDLAKPKKADEFVEIIVGVVRAALDRVPRGSELEGVGVASAGPLDLGRGGMASPANLPYGFVPLVRPIADACGTAVTLMNDANAAALGEQRFGAGRGCKDLVYVTLSTGIGGGAIVDGHLLSGKDGNAAEIGHLVVDFEGRLECGCGGRGHWEAYCSGRGIPRHAAILGWPEGRQSGGHARLGGPEASAIFAAAKEGDRLARRVLAEVGRFNAMGFANAINMFDPSLVTVGGGVALNNPEAILGPIRKMAPEHCIDRFPEVITTPLGDDAGLLGALSLAFDPAR